MDSLFTFTHVDETSGTSQARLATLVSNDLVFVRDSLHDVILVNL